jgi:hypothetical protein
MERRVGYVCPHCKRERRSVRVWWGTWDDIPLILGDDKTDIFRPSAVVSRWRGKLELYLRYPRQLNHEPFHCSFCQETLNAERVLKGFFEWLERLRERDLERYAKIIALLL